MANPSQPITPNAAPPAFMGGAASMSGSRLNPPSPPSPLQALVQRLIIRKALANMSALQAVQPPTAFHPVMQPRIPGIRPPFGSKGPA
jgi:hypothetical protein